jgi:radical SAM superfamily enzyme YgiQ (UPF0313 family)
MKVLLIVYDNDSHIHWFPQGLAYIAAVLRNARHEVEIYSQDLHHYEESHLTDFLNRNKFDIVGMSCIGGYYQYRKLLQISEAVNASANRPFYVLGGHGPSPEPGYFLKKTNADAIVIGEGEVTILDLVEAVANHRPLSDVKGIAFRDGDSVKVNEARPLIKDIDSIPMPAYDLFPMEYYRLIRRPHAKNTDFVLPVLSSRGCPFGCNFCYRMDKGYRVRSVKGIIDEIKFLEENYNITYIDFSDELLMSSFKRIVDVCESFMCAKLNIKWSCNGRLNYATPEILKLMHRAGCKFIGYGIECIDDKILEVMNKKLTVKEIVRGIEATLSAGISPGFNIIFGNIGENKEILQKGVDFLQKYDDHFQLRTIRPVTPYPGSPLYYYAIEKGLLEGPEDFYENKHLNSDLMAVNFTTLTDEEFHESLYEANKKLLENYTKGKMEERVGLFKKLYFNKEVAFRGLRQT